MVAYPKSISAPAISFLLLPFFAISTGIWHLHYFLGNPFLKSALPVLGAGGCKRLPGWFVHFLAQLGNVKLQARKGVKSYLGNARLNGPFFR